MQRRTKWEKRYKRSKLPRFFCHYNGFIVFKTNNRYFYQVLSIYFITKLFALTSSTQIWF